MSEAFSDLLHLSILFELILLIIVEPLCFFWENEKDLEYSSEILLASLVSVLLYAFDQSSRNIISTLVFEVFLYFITCFISIVLSKEFSSTSRLYELLDWPNNIIGNKAIK